MSLREEHIIEVLETTEAEFRDKRNKRRSRQNQPPVEMVDRAHQGIKANFRKLFGIDLKEASVNVAVNLRRNIRKILNGKNEVPLENSSAGSSRSSRQALSEISENEENSHQENTLAYYKEKYEMEKMKFEAEREKRIEAEKKFESVQQLFVVEKKRGNCFTYHRDLERLLLSTLTRGESPTSLHRFLEELVAVCPALIDHPAAKVPSRKYIQNLRKYLDKLCVYQMREFVDNAAYLTLTVDQTPCMKNEGVIGLGLVDDSGRYLSLALSPEEGKTGELIYQAMLREIRVSGNGPNIYRKIRALMSDRAPAQVNANSKFTDYMKTEFDLDIHQIPCLMHR